MLPDVAALATDQAAAQEDKESLVEIAEREEWIFGQVFLTSCCFKNVDATSLSSHSFKSHLSPKDSKAQCDGGEVSS